MQRFKYVAELVKKKKEKAETVEVEEATAAATTTEEPVGPAISQKIPAEGSTRTVADDPVALDVKKQSVERQSSSSSNNSGSDDWCIVDSSNGS
jgi:hypothetical protein